jgi:hypothetical protein
MVGVFLHLLQEEEFVVLLVLEAPKQEVPWLVLHQQEEESAYSLPRKSLNHQFLLP